MVALVLVGVGLLAVRLVTFDPGEKLEIDDEEPAGPKKTTRPRQESEDRPLPVPLQDWPEPSADEVAAAQGPRYYPQRQDGVMTLTVDAIGLYDVPVINENTQEALDNGVIHFPRTQMPGDERDQKNVYLALPGTKVLIVSVDHLSRSEVIRWGRRLRLEACSRR